MRITGVHLPGFGRLSDFSRELSPSLNVFHGDNEAGKSTLQQAIGALLYGFYDGDRARNDETQSHQRFRPWSQGPYRGSLNYTLDDGREFEVRRDFSSPDLPTQIIDSVLGIDVSQQFGRGRHGNIPFARKHLGMSRAVFQSCAFISQSEIFEIEKGATPSEIGDAIAALADSARRDVSAARAIERLDAALARIGSDRARTAELPKARDQLSCTREELGTTDRARAETAERASRLDDLQQRHQELGHRSLELRYLLAKSEAAAVAARLQAVRDAALSLDTATRDRDAIPARDTVTPELRDRVLTLGGGIEKITETYQRLARLRDEAAAAVGPSDRLEYEALRTSVGDLTEEQRRELEETAYREPQHGLIVLLRRLVRSIGRLIAMIVPGSRPSEADRPAPRFSREEALDILSRHQRFMHLRPLVLALETLERQARSEEAALRDAEATLLATARSAGIEADSTDGAVYELAAAWSERERHIRAAAGVDEAARALSAALDGQTEERLADLMKERAAEISAYLDRDPRLAELSTRHSANQLAQELRRVELEDRDVQLEAASLGKEVNLSLQGHRHRAEIEEDLAHWTREVDRLEKARSALLLARSVIDEAMTQVYRDFAPAVNSFLSEGIELVTEGRYRRVQVDPSTLRVSLLVPETDQIVTDPPVSHGTRSLIYVLMRIGLAQHMSAIGESVPLVLDDPFVDIDTRRLPRVLDFLLGLSDRMQILLFTKDETIVRWAEDAAGARDCKKHRMDALSPSPL